MNTIHNILHFLKDPTHVWRFQKLFGLKKIREVQTNAEEGHWIALDSRKVVGKTLPETVRVPSIPVITKTSFEREYRINQRVRAVRQPLDAEEDDICSSGYSSEGEPEEEASVLYYKIGNYFWYVLFHICTGLGDETFCAPMFAFIILNLDGNIGRKVMFMYCFLMYIGQALKDKIKWPRPSMPPVIQMERKWALEYGMPSTHAMVGLGMPISFFVFSSDKFGVDLYFAILFTGIWCALVSSSRIYLGMHSLADIAVGLILACTLIPPLILTCSAVDSLLVTWMFSPLFLLSVSFLVIWLYPVSDRWTPARGETTAILGCWVGVQFGYWLTYQVGFLSSAGEKDAILWDQWNLGKMLLRSVIGAMIGGLGKNGSRPLWIRLACSLAGVDHRRYEQSRNLFVELFYKFWSYLSFCSMVVFLSPIVFTILGCERSSFYTELEL